jgi:hypothetical protein
MKWYKHGAQSLNDAVISEAIAEFGGDGYLAFFGTLELMADEFDIFNPGIMSFSWRFLRKNLQLSRQKLTEIYSYFDEKAKENQSKDKGFLVLFADDGVTINCKKLAKLCDTHTQKLLRDRSKQLQSDIEVTSQKLTQEVRSKKEEVRSKNKKKNNNIYVEQAQRLFDYWKKVMGKPKAQFTEGRRKKISARLKEGYSEDDCAKAIENVSIDPWYSGDNDRNKEYNDIALIFRDGEHLEKYRDMKPQIKRADGFDGARLWLEIKEEQDGQKRQGKIHGTDAQDEGQPALPDKT